MEAMKMALDTNGIYLDEIKGKYPRSFQTLNYDVLLDTDSMGKPKVISSFDLGINTILTLLFMKPGQFPSIPELGIDIESYLFEYADDPHIPTAILDKINDQCNMIGMVGFDIEVKLDKTDEGHDAVIIEITGNERLGYGAESGHVIIGISYDKLNRLYVRKVAI